MNHYDSDFFATNHQNTAKTAAAMAPKLVEWLRPRSVIDVGCGTGTWLNEFHRLGIDNICGVEGDWAPTDKLEFPAEKIIRADLTREQTAQGRFDLVLSLEVGEHLPEESADGFVKYLCELGDVVLFSAAIPGQGGNDHRNEQWPDYWHEKFAQNNFEVLDVVRPQFWDHDHVNPCIRQNAFLLVRAGRDLNLSARSGIAGRVVHPEIFQFALLKFQWDSVLRQHMTLRKCIKMLPSLAWDAIKHRLPSKTA